MCPSGWGQLTAIVRDDSWNSRLMVFTQMQKSPQRVSFSRSAVLHVAISFCFFSIPKRASAKHPVVPHWAVTLCVAYMDDDVTRMTNVKTNGSSTKEKCHRGSIPWNPVAWKEKFSNHQERERTIKLVRCIINNLEWPSRSFIIIPTQIAKQENRQFGIEKEQSLNHLHLFLGMEKNPIVTL